MSVLGWALFDLRFSLTGTGRQDRFRVKRVNLQGETR